MGSDLVSSNSSQEEMEQQSKDDESIDMQSSPQLFFKLQITTALQTPTHNKIGYPTSLPTTSNITKKVKLPPITKDNPINTAALIKEIQQITGIKLTTRLAGNSLKLFLPMLGTYHKINRFIYQLYKKKKCHAS
ncbi:hypothetical protein NPIL_175001 [Nephila pilipes]|uniref:Uncharacterized protein n=1 Tax=Nephila pilipes TaxID=299642 RepID=A0A8X6P0G2_NEPPI|nr:hypothetical protein NPIL_175001 [Nephila pilipes]